MTLPTYGIGYVWGAQLKPALDGEIVLCTPDRLHDALAAHLGASDEMNPGLAGALAG